ncbi:MAG: two-component sensor histidine kinase, partial [Rothia sp. (in: high G+C Gram-positive bacteria)]|nr:two-component sensor histidine kinase [Rothia sp. (in: high G+C Gram-positive bacteria)]
MSTVLTDSSATSAVEHRPFASARRMWQRSLQFRAVLSAAVLLLVSFIFVGSFISHQIANSLFRGNLEQALEESSSGFSNVQTLLNASDATGHTEIQRDVARFLTVLETPTADNNREWILLRDSNTPSTGFISEQSQSGTITATDIPQDLAQTISTGRGIYWQSASKTDESGRTIPLLVVGTKISIPQNPQYTLYLVYDLSSS